MPLQIRRGTTAEREAITPLAGELVYDTTLGAVYVGDGATAGGLGVTAFTTEQAQDAVASLISAGTHTGITFTYNDVLGTLSATVEGAARLDINGSVYGDDSTPLVDSILNSFNLDGTIRSHVIPYADSVYDLGDATHKFRDLYLSGSSLYLGDAVVTSTGTAVNLPAGSTVNGVLIGSGSGDGVVAGSNYNINIVGDDSSIIVNSATGELIGNLTGDVTGDLTGSVLGSIFADDSSIILNSVTKEFNNGVLTISSNNLSVNGTDIIEIGAADGTNPHTLVFPDEQGTYMLDSKSLAGNILSISKIGFSSYKDSITSPSAPVAGDFSGAMIGQMYETLSASLVTTGGFVLGTDNNETIANDTVKGKMYIITNGGTGSSPSLKFCSFDASGRLAVNQQDAVATLDVNGFAKLAILSVAPSSPANGMIAIADGDNVAGWDPLGVPGKQQAVVYLGGGWRQLAVEP